MLEKELKTRQERELEAVINEDRKNEEEHVEKHWNKLFHDATYDDASNTLDVAVGG